MRLSQREEEIMDLVSQGYSDKEMAAELEISTRTIQTYITRINLKLRAKNRANAVAIYIKKQEDSSSR